MSKKYLSTEEIFAEQRRLLLQSIVARQKEKAHAKQMPPNTEPAPTKFALDEFLNKQPRVMKANRKPPTRLITLPTSQQIAMMAGLMFSVFPLATSDPGRLCFMCHMPPFTLPCLN